MKSTWDKKNIAELGRIVTGKTPKTSNPDNYGGDIPFLTPSDDMEQKKVYITRKTLSEEGMNEVKNCLLPPRSICVSCIGSDMGKVVMTTRPTITNQQINSIIPASDFDPDFIYYKMILLGKELNYIGKTSTAIPIINKTTFSNYSISLPSLSEQRAIAATLSCLDDKIELNNKINANLEAQAQAIFKSWFVDFEPFRDGEFVGSELGLIPKGWRISAVYDFATYINGAVFKKNEYSESGFPIIKIAELKNGITSSTQRSNIDKPSKNYIDNRDILFSWSGNPDTSIDVFIWHGGSALLNQHIFKVVPHNKAKSFIYCLLKYLKPEFTRIASNKQTTGLGHVTTLDLKKMLFVHSQKPVLEFCRLVDPFINMIYMNMAQNQLLAHIRDYLLPRVINGDTSVH